MELMELNLRTANIRGSANVKVKITGPIGSDGYVEVTCVETVTNDNGQIVIFSDEKGE
ncbi:MAG: hypothetical protein ACRYFU_26365 [Janthinobacterium lividum]